jgi:hypothetical protein
MFIRRGNPDSLEDNTAPGLVGCQQMPNAAVVRLQCHG